MNDDSSDPGNSVGNSILLIASAVIVLGGATLASAIVVPFLLSVFITIILLVPVDALMRSTNLLLGGKTTAVIGYGYCGQGIARYLRANGAHVLVVERDPLTRLEAHVEGFQTALLEEALPASDVVVTVTGRNGILGRDHFGLMKDGVLLANAGHFKFEMDIPALRGLAVEQKQVRPDIESLRLADGRQIFLLARGNLVNLGAGDGNPIEVMDLGMALQTLSLAHLVEHADSMDHVPHNVPPSVERQVAEMALAAWATG